MIEREERAESERGRSRGNRAREVVVSEAEEQDLRSSLLTHTLGNSLIDLVAEDLHWTSRLAWSPNGSHCRVRALLRCQRTIGDLIRKSDI